MADVLRDLEAARARVFLLFSNSADAGVLLRAAYAYGLGGAGYVWVGSDSVAMASTWLQADASLSSNETLREHVMTGFFGLTPGYGQVIGSDRTSDRASARF